MLRRYRVICATLRIYPLPILPYLPSKPILLILVGSFLVSASSPKNHRPLCLASRFFWCTYNYDKGLPVDEREKRYCKDPFQTTNRSSIIYHYSSNASRVMSTTSYKARQVLLTPSQPATSLLFASIALLASHKPDMEVSVIEYRGH